MKKKDERFFKLAAKEATKSEYDKIHIGCVAVYKNKVIAAGFNTPKTHPNQKFYNRYRTQDTIVNHYMHAEMMCINRIDESIPMEDVEIYNFRLGLDGNLRMSRPCKACMQRIKDLNITKIHYTTNFGFASETLGVIGS